MVNYYTLEEAARLLGTTPEELRKLADRNEIRAFRDRGNLRFRTQDIEERARQLGRGSDHELQPGEALRPRPTDSPQPRKADPGVFDFELEGDEGDQVDLGSLGRSEGPSSKRSGGRRSSKSGSPSPRPSSGSDSDVRLIPSGSDVDFEISADSDVKMVHEPPPPSSRKSMARRKPGAPDPVQDSGVRIVPLEGDSDVKMTPDAAEESAVSLGSPGPRSASDSDIRLAQEPSSARKVGSGKSKAEPPVTEEIDLDAELRQAGGSSVGRGPKSKSQLKPSANLPTSSPFELSQSDVDISKPTPPGRKKSNVESSSDFDLTPMGKGDQSPLSLDSDEEVTLGDLSARHGDSGINLQDPADSGISLEQGGSGDDIEIELSLDAGSTPKPAPQSGVTDSSSEFELSLDAGNSPAPSKAGARAEESDSEFELSLDDESASQPPAGVSESDSEFELTLDDSGGLAPLESEEESSEERDIFETDFEVPALDEESGSQAVALDEADTDLGSSDFDLATGEEEVAEEDSHSQVVAIEEEEDEVAAVTRPRRRRVSDEDEEDTEEDERPGRAVAAAAPAQWGVLPALVMFPCVIVLFLVGLMAFELVRGMWGYHQPFKVSGLIVRPMAEMFTDDLPKQ